MNCFCCFVETLLNSSMLNAASTSVAVFAVIGCHPSHLYVVFVYLLLLRYFSTQFMLLMKGDDKKKKIFVNFLCEWLIRISILPLCMLFREWKRKQRENRFAQQIYDRFHEGEKVETRMYFQFEIIMAFVANEKSSWKNVRTKKLLRIVVRLSGWSDVCRTRNKTASPDFHLMLSICDFSVLQILGLGTAARSESGEKLNWKWTHQKW